ncbi:MAG: MATE family efflux transporter [Saprospiraceae bacterium]|nr:MATE family efflux transporter [Saprospiraceae bacterium]
MRIVEFIKLFSKAVKGEEHDFTKGSINQALVLLAIPMILEMLMESLFAIVDVFFVAQVSINAVATIGMTEGVLMLIESVAIGIAMGATAMIARRIGEKQIKQASDVAVQAIILGVGVSLVTGGLSFAFADDILRLMGADESLIEEGAGYTRLILGLNLILMLLFVFNGIFRAAGNAAIAMRTLVLSNGLNIVLDPILILGLGPITAMGVEGAAIATCIGRGVGVLYQMYVLLSDSSIIKIYREHLRVNMDVMRTLIPVSAGGAGQFLISTASWIFLIRILASFGSSVLAGYTIAIRIIIFSILPSWGLSNATATLVGQNLGAGEPDRAEKTVWTAGFYNMMFLFVLSIIFFLFAKPISSIFTQDVLVINESALCLKIICLGYIFFAYQMVINQAFNGAGDTYTPTMLSFIFMWLVQIPLAYILAYVVEFNSMGVYMAISISSIFISTAAVYLFRKGKWKSQVV